MSDKNGSMLDRYLHREPAATRDPETSSTPRTEVESDVADDLGCFGYLRGIRDRAIMLQLRKADGGVLAIGYSWLERAELDPTEGIKLYACGRTITITGRKLNHEIRPHLRLFESITRHRVPWIQEKPSGAVDSSDSCIVESLHW